jgi:hypothetical protein
LQASEFVAREVNACRSEDEMDEIGEVYLHLPIAVTMVNHSAVSDGVTCYYSTVWKHKYATGSRSSSPSPPLSFETKKEMMRDMLHHNHQPEPEPEPQPDSGEFGSPLHLDHWRYKAKKNVSSRVVHSLAGRHTQSQGHSCIIHDFFCSLT